MHLAKLPSVRTYLSDIQKRSAAVAPRLPRTACCTAVSGEHSCTAPESILGQLGGMSFIYNAGKDTTPTSTTVTRRATLLQLGLSFALGTPAQAQDFISPLDSTERLPRGVQQCRCTVEHIQAWLHDTA